MRNISGGRTRSELTRNMNKSIMNAYLESYINTKEIDNYEFGINTVIKNEITNNNRKLEDSEVISILNSSIKSSHSNYPIRDTIFNKRPTNCLEWLVLELLDRIRCDILKFKRL